MALTILIVDIGNKEYLALRNNFAETKKFLITKIDCSIKKLSISFRFYQMFNLSEAYDNRH